MGFTQNPWQQQQRQKDAFGQPLATYGGGDTGGAGAGAAAPSPGATPQRGGTQGTGFINLQDYLTANQGSGARMAGQLAGGVQQAGDAAQQGLANAQAQYAQQTQQGTVQSYQPGTISNAMAGGGGRGSPLTAAPAPAAAAAAAPATPTMLGVRSPAPPTMLGARSAPYQAPVGVHTTPHQAPTALGVHTTQAPPEVAAARAVAGQTYTGPNSIADVQGFQGVADNATKAAQGAQALNTFEGRQAALQAQAGGPYTHGESLLDSFLSGAGGQPQLQGLQQRYGGLANQVASAVGDTSLGDAAKATSNQNVQGANDYVNQYFAQTQKAQQDAEDLQRQYAEARGTGMPILAGAPTFEQFQAMTPAQRAAAQAHGFAPGLLGMR